MDYPHVVEFCNIHELHTELDFNFFAQTCYVSECIENRAENLRMSIQSLYEVDPFTLRKELTDLYDKPIAKNKNFIKYNYTLEELKLALENEDTVFVVAS